MNPLKRLFFEETLRHWHFEDIRKASELSRERVNFYLKELVRVDLVTRVKLRKKMPYYSANRKNSHFLIEKKLFGLSMLEDLFAYINTCSGIKSAILFGSFARGDWGKSSDIDLFVYGDDTEFKNGEFELALKRDLQLFSFNNPKDMIKVLDPNAIPNIIKGFNIKGTLEPFEVLIHD